MNSVTFVRVKDRIASRYQALTETLRDLKKLEGQEGAADRQATIQELNDLAASRKSLAPTSARRGRR